MRIRCGLYGSVLACLAGVGTFACAQPRARSASPNLVLPAPVTLHVTVTDKSGRLVSGLQKSDFTLLDNRRSVPIQEFAPSSASQQPLVVLVVDQVNTPGGGSGGNFGTFRNLSIAQTQIGKFLGGYQSHLPFPVSLVFLTDSGISQIKPTQDGASLSAALHDHKPELQAISNTAGINSQGNLFAISLNDLQSILTYEASVPQRKLIVWIGSGWPVLDNPSITLSVKQQKMFFQEIVTISNLLRTTGTTVYFVDPEGNTDVGTANTVLWQNYLKPVTRFSRAVPGSLALQVIAKQSGGLLRFGGNNVAQEVSACTEDASGGYDITFQPQASPQPNTWHSLEVRLSRRNLKARTLDGYYAQP